jgi:hypothetical protein
VEAPGIESPTTSAPSVVDRRVDDADQATKGDAKPREVSASTRTSIDDAIRTGVKLAIDEGDLARAHALLDLLLLARPPVAPVVTLVRRKPLR